MQQLSFCWLFKTKDPLCTMVFNYVGAGSVVCLLLCCLLKTGVTDVILKEKSDTCGTADWIPFGLTKCFKKVTGHSSNFVPYAQAEELCKLEEADATLPSLNSAAEQEFLLDLVNGSVSDIWLGGRVANGTLGWTDRSPVTFSNWLHNDSLTHGTEQDCIQLNTAKTSRGKWTFGHCTYKFNDVVCQKNQSWESSALQRILMSTKVSLAEEITGLRRILEDVTMNLTRLVTTCEELKAENRDLTSRLEDDKARSIAMETDLNSVIPVGFIYVQYGSQAEPKVLWPSLEWVEVTGKYGGQFFRAVGGQSGQFGVPQESNAPQLSRVSHQWVWRRQRPNENFHGDVYPQPGQTTGPLRTGRAFGSDVGSVFGITFTMSDGEVRPYNSAVRIWKRI